MVRHLIGWALNNPLVVILLACALAVFGVYSFLHVNVEAYPDPSPPLIEVIAQNTGMSAEEMERLVTVPLEVTLANIPRMRYMRSYSQFGLSDVRCQFEYDTDYNAARQEVINRLAVMSQPLPPGVVPSLSPESATGEIYRYTLNSPKDASGDPIYTLNDLKALQDWVMERQFRRVPRIVDLTSFGGTVKRYEIHPDPDRMKQFGITLGQIQTALGNANMNTGGDYVPLGPVAMNTRCIGLFGAGLDPVTTVLGMKDPDPDKAAELEKAEREKGPERFKLKEQQRVRLGSAAAAKLREEEADRIRQIRNIVLTAVNNRDIALEDIVEGGRLQQEAFKLTEASFASLLAAGVPEAVLAKLKPLKNVAFGNRNEFSNAIRHVLNPDERERFNALVVNRARVPGEQPGERGVVVGNQTRLGKIIMGRPAEVEKPDGVYRVVDAKGKLLWRNEPDVVQCIVLLRKNEESLPAIKDVEKKVAEINDPQSGLMLPGVFIEPYYDRTDLINVTTDTVRENLFVGISLVILVLFMFVSNVRTAIIVAINIPLALLFAYAVLFLRGQSANLLSIGAVDFGIIVDSSVIMVENIYRNLASGEFAGLPIKDRIIRSTREIDRALLFSTGVMVCAFIPLFAMSGPEGALFGPMAHTYAFSLGAALLLAMTLTPVLSMFFFKNMKPAGENFLVRALKWRYLWKLQLCIKYPKVTVALMTALILGTATLIPKLGHEFMPELEEGNLWVRSRFALNMGLDRASEDATQIRNVVTSYPEVDTVIVQVGRPDDGTDVCTFSNFELFVNLLPEAQWPKLVENTGWRRWLHGDKRPRTKTELIEAMNAELRSQVPGADYNFSQNIRDNVMESLSGIKGDNSVKIFGPDLDKLDALAEKVKERLDKVEGIKDVGVFTIKGQTDFNFRVDLEKCRKWGVSANDVTGVVATAIGGKAYSTMIEGEKQFDISVRWPKWRRSGEETILDIPVDIINNQVVLSSGPSWNPNPSGSGMLLPQKTGYNVDTSNQITSTPRRTLRDFVTPVGKDGRPDPDSTFVRPGAATIYREGSLGEGSQRLCAIKFSVRGRDLGGAVNEAREKTKDLFQAPYRAVWSGEFEEMEAAEAKLFWIVPMSLGLIFILLYIAFRSLLDALVVLSNVFDVALGGIWALYLTGTPFSISAAVGFISLFGVAVMEGLLLISYFNALRAQGLQLNDAIVQGALKRVRPVMITAMTAILGLLPAAFSTKIGAQTQRPLAIVVVGGMAVTLLLDRYLMPALYTFYGKREPPEGSGSLAH
ncbi:MAG TPA: efflux RND transporter permease subunit [Gemmataceae bacterium]|nr:efflux RND transporter permease subunit [Gemmataceae bacterium]